MHHFCYVSRVWTVQIFNSQDVSDVFGSSAIDFRTLFAGRDTADLIMRGIAAGWNSAIVAGRVIDYCHFVVPGQFPTVITFASRVVFTLVPGAYFDCSVVDVVGLGNFITSCDCFWIEILILEMPNFKFFKF